MELKSLIKNIDNLVIIVTLIVSIKYGFQALEYLATTVQQVVSNL